MSQNTSSYDNYAKENMSYNTADGKPPKPKEILMSLISKQYGPQNAAVMETALKHQDTQIEEAMNQGMTVQDIAKSKGIDLNNLEQGKKGNFWHTPFQVNDQTGEVTPESILGGLIKSHPDDTLKMAQARALSKGTQSLNTEEEIQKGVKFQKILDEQFPGHQVTQTAEGNWIIHPKTNEQNDMIMSIKEDQFKQRRLQTMGDDLDPSKNVRNPYGVAQLGLSRTERIEGLVNQYKDLNLDKRETEELAIGLNSMLQGSNVSARSQVESLVPKSIRGNAQKLTEWLVNEPQGMQQQQFVKRMLSDVLREKKVFQGQVMKFARSKVAKYSDLMKKYPEETNDIMKSFGVDPSVYSKWKEGGFKDAPPIDVAEGNDTEVLKRLNLDPSKYEIVR